LQGFTPFFTAALGTQNPFGKFGHAKHMVEIVPRIDGRDPTHAIAQLAQTGIRQRTHFRAHSGL
jgi:hypothetical protein